MKSKVNAPWLTINENCILSANQYPFQWGREWKEEAEAQRRRCAKLTKQLTTLSALHQELTEGGEG